MNKLITRYIKLFIKLIIHNLIVIYLLGSSILYRVSSGIYGVHIITQYIYILTWVPNTDTPVII